MKHAASFDVQVLAARVVRCVYAEGAPVRGSKSLCHVPAARRKSVFACATETMRSLRALRAALAASTEVAQRLHNDMEELPIDNALSSSTATEDTIDTSLACVLLHDLLDGRWLDSSRPAVRLLLQNQRVLREVYHSQPVAEVDAVSYLIFGRVNTLITTVEEAVAALHDQGWSEQWPALGVAAVLGGESLSVPFSASSVGFHRPSDHRRAFCRDALFSDVLAFPPGAPVRGLTLVADGRLLLQDRASCACAHVLAPRRGAHVIDACAAPGKKASHCAALMADEGRVSAFDREPGRAAAMREFLASAHATCATTHAADFLSVDPHDAHWADVEGVLLDPSCSGSGTTFFRQDGEPAIFAHAQLELLLHAMRFPAVVSIVYSTCSTSEEENEGVVAAALAARPDWMLRRPLLPGWPRRGLAVCGLAPREAAATVRFCSKHDLCLGFFIACFEPRPPDPPPSATQPSRSDGLRKAKKRVKKRKRGNINDSATSATSAGRVGRNGAST